MRLSKQIILQRIAIINWPWVLIRQLLFLSLSAPVRCTPYTSIILRFFMFMVTHKLALFNVVSGQLEVSNFGRSGLFSVLPSHTKQSEDEPVSKRYISSVARRVVENSESRFIPQCLESKGCFYESSDSSKFIYIFHWRYWELLATQNWVVICYQNSLLFCFCEVSARIVPVKTPTGLLKCLTNRFFFIFPHGIYSYRSFNVLSWLSFNISRDQHRGNFDFGFGLGLHVPVFFDRNMCQE